MMGKSHISQPDQFTTGVMSLLPAVITFLFLATLTTCQQNLHEERAEPGLEVVGDDFDLYMIPEAIELERRSGYQPWTGKKREDQGYQPWLGRRKKDKESDAPKNYMWSRLKKAGQQGHNYQWSRMRRNQYQWGRL